MDKKEKQFLEEEAKTFEFGFQLFGPVFMDYSLFFMDYPKNFRAINSLATSQNFKVSKRSVITLSDRPFGLDQFILLAPMVISPSTLLEIVYGKNDALNSYLENYYHDDNNQNESLSLLDLEEVATIINNK